MTLTWYKTSERNPTVGTIVLMKIKSGTKRTPYLYINGYWDPGYVHSWRTIYNNPISDFSCYEEPEEWCYIPE